MGRQLIVKDSASYAKALSGTAGIEVQVISQRTIGEISSKFLETWERVPGSIPGTRNCHWVRPIGRSVHMKFFSDEESYKERDIQRSQGSVGSTYSPTADKEPSLAEELLEAVLPNEVARGTDIAIALDLVQPILPNENTERVSTPERGRQSKNRNARRKGKKKRDCSADDTTPCTKCKVRYGNPADAKIDEEWWQCVTCHKWYHQSCAEESWLLDDNDMFTCMSCL